MIYSNQVVIQTRNDVILRKVVYLYCLFILFDGIFRKWMFPAISLPVMMIKQVIAIYIFFKGLKYLKNQVGWEISSIVVGVMVFCTSLIFGHGNLLVTIWGCLPYWFGIPVCFIIGKVLLQEDVINLGKLIVYISIINSILVIVQYNLPAGHLLNFNGFQVEENIRDMYTANLSGMFRPSGIFVASSQYGLFLLLALPFTLYFLFIYKGIINRTLLLISIILLLTSCICSASRTNIMYSVGIIFYFVVLCMNRKKVHNFILGGVILVLLLIAFVMTPMGSKAVENIANRFENASEVQYRGKSTTEGTFADIYDRAIGYNINAIVNPTTIDGKSVPFFGYGQGMSTQVGGKLLSHRGGRSGFALAEWDGLRIMCESGILLGWLIIFIRLGYVVRFIPSIMKYRKKKMYLSVILYPSFFISFYLLNTWGNIFLANFSFFSAGLFLASIKRMKINNIIK